MYFVPRKWFAPLSVLVLIGGTISVAISEDKKEEEFEEVIALVDAPAAIQQAVKGLQGTDFEIAKEAEDGKTVYEIEFEADDAEVTLELTADGKLLNIEVEEDEDDK